MTAIVNGTHSDPFAVLGMHSVPYKDRHAVAVRVFLPGAAEAFVVDIVRRQQYPMMQVHEAGVFEALFSRRRKHFAYCIEVLDSHGEQQQFSDPYAFPPVLEEQDLQQFQAGTHETIYECLGSHPVQVNGVSGTLFAVWAPNAGTVCVSGDFNNWHACQTPMRCRAPYGVWELFIPGVEVGAHYQYTITTADGEVLTKTDPYGFHGELHWNNEMSIVADVDRFPWTDHEWLQQRDQHDPLTRPIAIYEVHLGSWLRASGSGNNFLNYREMADTLIPYVKDMGFTYIELLPIAEHPYYPSWGYQVTGYYAPTSRYGDPEALMYFINECHRQGIGVIMDWVPAHFPKDEFSLGQFDGTYVYEHEDPRMAEHKDWGTLIFDYGKPEVKNFLLANAIFWFEKYHIDGIRADAVASMLYLDYSRREGEWVPNKYGGRENIEAIDFLKDVNAKVHDRFQGVMTIAEESTSWLGVTSPAYLGGLDFSFKWNLGWMNDMLHYLAHAPDDRKYVHTMVPFALLYAFHEHFMLELSHDEVVHGKGSLINKMPGDEWQKFANLRVLFGFMYGHPGKKLLFMGNEFGQRREWNHDTGLEWELLEHAPHCGLQAYVRDLNHLYASQPALYADYLREQGFAWIDYQDFQNSVIVFLRRSGCDDAHPLVFVCNFLPNSHAEYRIGVPHPGRYEEVLNSDDAVYGGRDVKSLGVRDAEPVAWQRQPYSLKLSLPPLSVVVLQKESGTTALPSHKREESVLPKTSPPSRAALVPVAPIVSSLSEQTSSKSGQAAILRRGLQASATASMKGNKDPENLERGVYMGPHASAEGRPQGSKRAILAEYGVNDDSRHSSG
jgi:1,4-alpha-glucan branching enzyme